MHRHASVFGKKRDSNASQEDIAKGIIYMVLQTIGGAAVLSALNGPIKDFVLIGNLTKFPQCQEVFPNMEKKHTGCAPSILRLCGEEGTGHRGGALAYTRKSHGFQ